VEKQQFCNGQHSHLPPWREFYLLWTIRAEMNNLSEALKKQRWDRRTSFLRKKSNCDAALTSAREMVQLNKHAAKIRLRRYDRREPLGVAEIVRWNKRRHKRFHPRNQRRMRGKPAGNPKAGAPITHSSLHIWATQDRVKYCLDGHWKVWPTK